MALKATISIPSGAAAVSALASLVTEKILKGERDAFHVQKAPATAPT